jgi:hypothetical protein
METSLPPGDVMMIFWVERTHVAKVVTLQTVQDVAEVVRHADAGGVELYHKVTR